MGVLHLLTAGFFVLSASATSKSTRRPHIIHIVADDIGHHDLGLSNSAMKTPNIDALARGGVQLTHFYAQRECAPSRTSMMTGRLPFHYGYYQNPSDDGAVPTNYTMIPQVLKAQGYRTHAIGKWHCGFKSPDHTPTHRGFESFVGFWHWGEEYLDHAFPPYYKTSKCRGVDFVNSSGVKGAITPLMNLNGTLSTTVFVNEFARILARHDATEPLYVYLAFQNAHDPYEHAPMNLVKGFDSRAGQLRRNFSAIVEDLDNGVGSVVKLLEKAGIWEDTILWFNSDNGGELPFADQSKCDVDNLNTGDCGGAGNNWPLRGGKFTLFEGGVRVRAFIHSPRLPVALRGTEWSGLAHVSDIFPTMAGLVGAADFPAVDGFDLWPAIMTNSASPRRELLHQPLNVYWNASCTDADLANPFMPGCGGALTVWPYKLLVGFPGDTRVVETPSGDVQESQLLPRDACTGRPCLYNIEADPSEAHDLFSSHSERGQRLLARLHELSAPEAAPQPADALTPEPSDAACAVVTSTGAWLPWAHRSTEFV